ncbi:oligosaccharide flippase family protein [Priestia megaterium]|uniref:oligosaccharide flippase family protein n=1 Tax=Priestia megaterium TaxID=1404 RepID=UPI00300B192A
MKFFKRIFAGKYLNDIITLSIGTIIAQLITIIISPITTRIYTPSQLGLYTLVMTIVSVIGPNINGRFDLSIVTSDSKKEADTLTVTSTIISICMTLLISIALTLIYLFKPEMLNKIGAWVFILIPICLISGLTNTLLSYNNKYKQYKLIRSVSVLRSLALSIGQVSFGFLGLGVAGLFISQVISLILGLKRQAKYCLDNYKQLLLTTRAEIIFVIKKYKKQAIYSFPANVMNAMSYSITYFFITSLYGVNEVGYYSLCQTILGLPITLICSNVSRVFFRQASETRKNNGNFFSIFKKTTLILSAMSIPIFLILFLFGDKLFAIIFGADWKNAGQYAQIMAPMFAIRFITIPVISALLISGKQNLEFVMQLMFILLSVITYFLAKIFNYSIENYLNLTSAMFFINYLIMLLIIYRISKLKVQ